MATRGVRSHIEYGEDTNSNYTGHNFDPTSSDPLLDIRKLLERQNNLLEKLVKPHETDASLKPLPPVSARSSSAWNSLLTSTLNNTAPIIGRWQGRLDTLLIFVGFFSSIVTSFLVDSSHSLRVDEVMRTNELLTNLTEIILFVSGDRAANITLLTPKPFVPDPADVRVNVYWSLSLILSISAAALAVAGRGFLSLLIKPEGDVVTKLTELYQRRAQARSLLGPVLEALPQVLLVPFVLFVLGLLDDLLSSSFSNPNITFPTLISSVLLCIVVAAVGLLLIGAVTHGIIYPRTSPFQTLLSQKIWRRKSFKKPISGDFLTERKLDNFNRYVFHSVIQETFEDETLDQASAALEGIIFNNAEPSTSLTDLEIRTILHLLSPEASLRSNLSAARIVMNFSANQDPESELNPTYRTALLLALRHAADRHQANWPHLVEWHQNSLFVSAMASLIPSSARNIYPHPMIALLSANHLPLQELPTELREACISLVWQAVSSLTRTLGRLKGAKRDEELHTTLRQILGPCSIDPTDGSALLLSLMYSPVQASETSYQDLADYTVIIECICTWLAEGEFAADTMLRMVHRVLIEIVRPEGHFPYRSYPGVVQTVLKFVLCKTKDLSFDNLMVCIYFILRVQETFLWDVGHFMTLRIVLRFLDLLEKSRGEMHGEHREWNICHNVFVYVHQWMLYKASALGEYSPDSVGLPSRKDFLERMSRISKDFFDADQGDAIPLPLPEWELRMDENPMIDAIENQISWHDLYSKFAYEV